MAIMGFLFGSVILHALGFYLFQIIYPPAVALLPPPGRVNLIAPNSDEGRVLLRWLEAEDPALASTTQPPADGKALVMPTIQHAPSYLSRQPALRDVPPLVSDLRVPSAQPPAPVQRMPAPIPTTPKISPTILRFSPELEALGPAQGPEMKFAASSREAPQAAQFHIAVNENGEVRYCFLEDSSGDAALDDQARKYLALSRFPAIRNPQSAIHNGLVWGSATVEWGNDVAAPSSQTQPPSAP
jgi:hypothetical protein